MWAALPMLLVDLRPLSAQESGVASVMGGEVELGLQWEREGGGLME